MAFSVTIPIESMSGLANKLRQVEREAATEGVAFEGDTSSGMFSGVLSGSYRVADGEIQISITDKPWYAPEGMIREKLLAFFA